MTSSAGNNARGFTLIELLVSLALLGMAATLLLTGLQTAGLIARGERRQAIGLEDVVTAQRILGTTIEQMRPVTRLDSAFPIVDVRGTEAVLTFVAPPLARGAPDALQRFRLTRTADGDLVLYAASTRKPGIDLTGVDVVGWSPTTLLHHVAALRIDYRGPASVTGARTWQTRWWDQPQAPDLVRIRLSFAPGDRRDWPDLLIRPRATAGCAIDVATGRCGVPG